MALIIKTHCPADADEKAIAEIIVYQAVQRVGVKGWLHISESHRAGLIAYEGLSLVLAQATSSVDVLKKVARVSALVSSVASRSKISTDSCGRKVITVDFSQS